MQFVFGSLGQTYKVDPGVFELWMRLLRDIPGSVLWQLASHPNGVANMRRRARSLGVDPDRITAVPKIPQMEHLGRLGLADLALDTFPCNGHTTTRDALWVDVPVVTMIGETFASRVAASNLHAHGLDDLVTTSMEDYFQRAHQLATQAPTWASCKERLALEKSHTSSFTAEKFTRDVESLYAAMWDQQRLGTCEAIVLSQDAM